MRLYEVLCQIIAYIICIKSHNHINVSNSILKYVIALQFEEIKQESPNIFQLCI